MLHDKQINALLNHSYDISHYEIKSQDYEVLKHKYEKKSQLCQNVLVRNNLDFLFYNHNLTSHNLSFNIIIIS